MSAVYEQTPIRVALQIVSNPPVAPVDANTGNAPSFWRGSSVSMQFGIFAPDGEAVDLSNLSYVQVSLQSAQDSQFVLWTKQVDAGDITDTIEVADWRDGSSQQFAVTLDPADTDQGLGGESSAEFWLTVVGVTTGGAPIVYGAGAVEITVAAAVVPAPTATPYTSLHEQTNADGNLTISPTTQIHTEVVTIEGDARTSLAILGIVGMQAGALLNVVVVLPETADITVNFVNGSVSGDQLSTLTTGSVLQALLQYYFDYDAQTWVPLKYSLPSP